MKLSEEELLIMALGDNPWFAKFLIELNKRSDVVYSLSENNVKARIQINREINGKPLAYFIEARNVGADIIPCWMTMVKFSNYHYPVDEWRSLTNSPLFRFTPDVNTLDEMISQFDLLAIEIMRLNRTYL